MNFKFILAEQTWIEGPNYCIHVTHLPATIASEELSDVFQTHVANILLREHTINSSCPALHEVVSYEAWIKNIGDEKATRALANRTSNTELQGSEIKCQCVREPVLIEELCRHFMTDSCRYASRCNYKHLRCQKPNNCSDPMCHLGHAASRQTKSKTHRTKTSKNCFFIFILPFLIHSRS